MDLELEGIVALVVGGSGGIGRAAAKALASEGAHVAIAARGEDGLRSAAESVRLATNCDVLTISVDTRDDDEVAAMVDSVVSNLGPVGVLVNSAAPPNSAGSSSRWDAITSEDLLGQIDVKVMGYIRCIRAVGPCMIAEKWGRIINLAGGASRHIGSTVGSIRNAGVVAMSKNFAAELGPHGVNVVAIHPGRVVTESAATRVVEYADQYDVSVDQGWALLYGNNHLQRPISAEDVAHVIAFLASPKAVGITGEVVATGGGTESAIFY